MTKLVLMILTYLGTLQAQQMDGIYQLELVNRDGNVISKATGFIAEAEQTSEKYLLSSFHFLNSRLLEADTIRVVDNKNARYSTAILSYSELNDILVLEAPTDGQEAFKKAKQCKAPYYVSGYYKDKLLAIKTDSAEKTELNGVYKLSVYLKKGLSGSPLLNAEAEYCGMIVLSSEQNASSVAVSYSLLKQELAKAAAFNQSLSVNDVKRQLGVEITVTSQEEINKLVFDNYKQYVVNIDSIEEKFVINGASNIVITSSSQLDQLIVTGSVNVMIKNLYAKKLIINKSQSVTIESCIFENSRLGIYVAGSSDVMISNNKFTNLAAGVVLKGELNTDSIVMAKNDFSKVKDNVVSVR